MELIVKRVMVVAQAPWTLFQEWVMAVEHEGLCNSQVAELLEMAPLVLLEFVL